MPGITATLRRLSDLLPADSARSRSLDDLERPGTVAVLTGQQPGIFGGPLLTFYKAATAVAIARLLEGRFGVRAVPVFWIQSEDHDYEEIRRGFIPTSAGDLAELAFPALDAERISLAHRNVPDESRSALALLEETVHSFPDAPAVIDRLSAAYEPGRPLSEAFASVLALAFSETGLLFFQPRQPEVSTLLSPLLERVYRERHAIEQLLRQQGEKLRSEGREEQVAIRPRSPLFFFHPSGAEGPRFRIVENGGWTLMAPGERSIDVDLDPLIHAAPMCFSASALLRPLCQDYLFPTAVYVGGPAELAYFSQIAPLYDHLGLPRPILAPRARFLVIEARARRLLDELQVVPSDLQRSDLLQEILDRNSPAELAPHHLRQEGQLALSNLFHRYRSAAEAVDPTLVGAVLKTEERTSQYVASLLDRYVAALARREQVTHQRLTLLQSLLRPQGVAQERMLLSVYFLARYGKHFIARIFESIELDSQLEREVRLDIP